MPVSNSQHTNQRIAIRPMSSTALMCTSCRRLCRIFHSSVSESCIEWWSPCSLALPIAPGDSTCPETARTIYSIGENRASCGLQRSSLHLLGMMPGIVENEVHPGAQSLDSGKPEALIGGRSAAPRRETGITRFADLEVDVMDAIFAVRDDADALGGRALCSRQNVGSFC